MEPTEGVYQAEEKLGGGDWMDLLISHSGRPIRFVTSEASGVATAQSFPVVREATLASLWRAAMQLKRLFPQREMKSSVEK